jgi:hypothetical protein
MSMMSEQINELVGALAKAQGAMDNPHKNKTVKIKSEKGQYDFSYATLDSIIDTIRKPLSDNAIVFMQTVRGSVGSMELVTTLAHSSGQWISSTLPIEPQQRGPQALGSAISYVKRYALSAMLGLAADEDDDANTSEGNHVQPMTRKPANTAQAPQRPAQPALDADKQDKALRGSQERTAAKIKLDIAGSNTQDELKSNYTNNKIVIAALPEDLKAEVIAAAAAQKALLMDEAA